MHILEEVSEVQPNFATGNKSEDQATPYLAIYSHRQQALEPSWLVLLHPGSYAILI